MFQTQNHIVAGCHCGGGTRCCRGSYAMLWMYVNVPMAPILSTGGATSNCRTINIFPGHDWRIVFFFLQDCKLQCGSYFSLPGHACGSPVALGFLGHDGFLHANLIHIYCVKFYLHGCPAQKTEAQSLLAAMPLLGALARVHARVLQFLPTLLSKSFGLSSFSSKAGIDLRCFFCEGHDLGVQIFVYCLVFVRKWGKQFLCIMPDKWRSLKRVAIAFS